MSLVEYVVRDATGSVQRGNFPEGDPSTIYVSYSKDISLNLSPAGVQSYERHGDDLLVMLDNGEVLVLNGYFESSATGEKSLFLSQHGDFVEVDLGDAQSGILTASYDAIDVSGKWSAYDDMVFLDIDRIEPVIAPLAAPLLSPWLLGGAAAAGGAALIGGGGGDGGGGGGSTIQPTVDDPDATHLIGGDGPDTAVLTGTGAPGSEVVVTIGTQTQTVTVDDNGIWTCGFDPDALPDDGIYPTTVVVTDPNGTVFDLTGPTVDIDTTPPEIAVVSGTQSTGDMVNGASHVDGATITGTGEPGATVDVTIDGTTHSTTVAEDGSWTVTFATSEIVTGEYETAISITTTDIRGNSATSSDVLEVDTVAPLADLNAVEGDDIVNAGEASDGTTLTGTGEAGALISLEFQGITRTTTVGADGSWTMDFDASEIAGGTYDSEITITSTDLAGNSSVSTHTIHIDTEQALSLDGPISGDDIVNAVEQAAGVTLSGTAEAGSSVVVTMGGVSHTVTAGADGSWSAVFAAADIAPGTYDAEVTVVATDLVGNVETTTGSVHIDTENAVALDATQAGNNVIDATEAANGVAITGTAEAGATVEVMLQGLTHSVTAGADGSWSAVFSASEIPAGEYDADITVTSTDLAGNTSSATGTVHVDTETAVSLDTPVTGDNVINGVEAAGGVSLTGQAEAGASVVVTMGGVSHTVTADASGNWSAAFAAAEIAPGQYDAPISVTATDTNGNIATTTGTVAVDTTTVLGIDAGQAGGDNLLNAAEAANGITLTGTAEPSAAVQVTFQGITRSVTADASGNWSAAYSFGEVTPGEYDAPISVTATDLAGNTESTTGQIRVDTETMVDIAPGHVGGDSIVNAAEAQAGVTFTGEAEPGASVLVTVAGVTRTATVDSNGNWSAVFGAGSLQAGEYDTTISVASTDAAGNTATTSTDLRVDTTAGEVALSPLPIEIDDVINAAERADGVVINGTATPGLTVTVTLGSATQQVIADANGNWSINVPASSIPTGTQDLPITASITDAAGNHASVSDSVHLDTEVTNLAFNSGAIEGDNIVNEVERADGVNLTGTVEPGSSVIVQMGGATQAAIVDAAGNWQVSFDPGSIPQGAYDAAIVVTATDPAGNTEVIQDSVRIDTESLVTSDANQTSDDVLNAVERANGVTLTGSSEAGSTISVELQGVTRSATVDANGNWSVAFAAAEIPEGTYAATATITATDVAGNIATTTESFDVDTEVDNPSVDSVTFVGADVGRIGTQDVLDSYTVNTLETDGSVGSPDSTISTHPVFGTEFTFNTPISDGTNLVVSREDAAGNESSTLVVLEDGAGNTTTIDHAGLGSFDIQALNLDYGDTVGLVLTEAQIQSLSGSSDTLTIHGGSDDTLTVTGATSTGQTEQIDGQTYNVYTIGDDGTTLVIEQDITVII